METMITENQMEKEMENDFWAYMSYAQYEGYKGTIQGLQYSPLYLR